MNPLTTVLLNPLFGLWQDYRPTTEIFLCDIIATSFGYLCMALSDNQWIFLVGYILSRVNTAQGGVRAGYLIKTTSFDERTLALTILPLASIAGALIGPIITFVCAYMPSIQLSNGILFDQNTLVFWVCLALSVVRLPLLFCGFRETPATTHTATANAPEVASGSSEGVFPLVSHPRARINNPWKWLLYFAVTLFLFQISSGVYTPLFNLLLVDVWEFSQKELSLVLLVVIILSIPPPSLMAWITRRWKLQDRLFLLIGLLLGFFAMLVFAFPSNSIYTLLVGGILSAPMTITILPAANALYSKKVGPKIASGFRISLLTSASSLGYAVGTLLSNFAVRNYDSFELLLWSIPVVVAILAVVLVWTSLGFYRSKPGLDDLEDWTVVDFEYQAPSPLCHIDTPPADRRPTLRAYS
jgi:MFS family permease